VKVILLQDVKGSGKAGQVINVSDGHAKNMLLPRKLAVEATKAALADWEKQQKNIEKKRQNEVEAAQALGTRIENTTVKIPMKVGESGKMFGSVGAKEIAAAMASQAGIDIDRRRLYWTNQLKISAKRR